MSTVGPLLLEPKLDSRLWGGDRLGPWMQLASPPQNLAEAWLVYDRNKVRSGPHAGTTLAALAKEHGAALVGRRTFQRQGGVFPLLAKLIDAREQLSVQVHPDDALAHELEPETGFGGKTEAWHILEARPGADVFLGVGRPLDAGQARAAALEGTLPGLLRRVEVRPGDTLMVPARTVHAINGGLLLFEIQQTSDLTYRLFDYGRRGPDGQLRPLHLDKALKVADLSAAPPPPAPRPGSVPWATCLVSCAFFELERWDLDAPVQHLTSEETFEILAPVEGKLTLRCDAGTLELARGDAVVLPANLGRYTLNPIGETRVLRSFAP